MPLARGALLGPYEILAPIGAGGMGEVYKARDTRLDRIVAIKVAQTQFSERFEREARAVAALNHPNICQLYDVGPNYLVMEFVEGTRIALTDNMRRLLDLAVQIADGLSAAHAAKIVHRDLKPDNILVTAEGRIKILDFGLAKSSAEPPPASDATLTMGITDPGTTVGTVNYMSPEQARGETNLTPQSDQFSFGLVLYELASGKRAFQRASAPETMAAIIRDDAEPLSSTVPAPLRWVIERLLAKEPAERYDSTRDLYRELRQIRERRTETASAQQIPATTSEPAPKKPWRAWPIAATGIATGLAAGMVAVALLLPPPQADLAHYRLTPITRDGAEGRYPAWSPDGKNMAYAMRVHGVAQVFVKAIGSPDTAQLTHAASDCRRPSWSPDGAVIYYVSGETLWSIGASGGTPERVLDGVRSAAPHPDGKTLAFVRDEKLWIGALKGGPPREIWRPPRQGPGWLGFSPDGSKLAFIDVTDLWIMPYPSGAPRNLGPVGFYGASWFPDSRHLLAGNPLVGLSSGLVVVGGADASRRTIHRATGSILESAVSPDGKKAAYAGGATEWNALEISISDGQIRTMVGGSGISLMPDWAPSGTHYLVATEAATGSILEDRSATDGFARRLVDSPSAPHVIFSARWSPDGTRLLFDNGDGGTGQLIVANASGGGWTPVAEINGRLLGAHVWSPDGQWIAFVRLETGKQRLLKVRPVAGAAPEIIANAAPALTNYEAIQWSPKGDWILYSAAEGMAMVSPDGATVRTLTPHKLLAYGFSKDGSYVYGIFQNTTGNGPQWQLRSVDVKTGVEKFLAPLDLPASTNDLDGFSLHPDGKRFLTSIAKWPFDIWMLEGFDPPREKTWLERLLRR